MSSQSPKNFFKTGLLRWALNCSVTALILSIISIAIASYALSFNVIPVPIRSLAHPASRDNRQYDSHRVRAMQSSFLSDFFRLRRSADETTFIFQSIPLCGGDIFPGLVEKLRKSDGARRFQHVAEFTEQYPVFPNGSNARAEMENFMKDFIAKSPKPLFLFTERGAVPFIEDSNVHYISLICDPAHRLIETYRVDHMGDDMQYALPRGMRMKEQPIPFETCFKKNLSECYGPSVQTFIVQHFCNSNNSTCRSPNLNVPLEASLETASRYKAIGRLEEFDVFLKLVEQNFPDYFSGITKIFATDDEFEAFRTKRGPLEGITRPNVTTETFKKLQKHIWPDYGFYWKTRRIFTLHQNTNAS